MAWSEEPRPHPEEPHAPWQPHPGGVKAAGTQHRAGRWVGARREARGPQFQQGHRCVMLEVVERAGCREVNPQPSGTGRGEERFPLAVVAGLPPFGSETEVGRRRSVREGAGEGRRWLKATGVKGKTAA